jgi:chemotaxis protein CheY-P-specific phosphatase CheC
MHPIPDEHRGHGGGSLRVFKQFAWLEAGSVKAVLSRPTHQLVTHTVETVEKVSFQK